MTNANTTQQLKSFNSLNWIHLLSSLEAGSNKVSSFEIRRYKSHASSNNKGLLSLWIVFSMQHIPESIRTARNRQHVHFVDCLPLWSSSVFSMIWKINRGTFLMSKGLRRTDTVKIKHPVRKCAYLMNTVSTDLPWSSWVSL